MKKRILGKYDIISLIICLMTIIPGLMIYKDLPKEVAVHFDINGNADGFASRGFTCFAMPLIFTAIQLVLCIITNLAWKEEKNKKGEMVIKILPAIVFFVMMIWMLLNAKEKNLDIKAFVGIVMTVIFLVCGNFLPKIRRNAFYGIRTPHTLASPEVWDKTHRFAGPFVFVSGFLSMIITVMGMHLWVLFVIILVTIIVPLIYSEIVYREFKKSTK